MHYFVLLLCLFVSLEAEIQKAQITQSYSYASTSDEFYLEEKNNQILLIVKSEDLEHFLNSNLNSSQIDSQSVILNGGYTEFQNVDKDFKTYTNSNSMKPKKQFYELIFEIQPIDNTHFTVLNAQEFFHTMHCKFIVQKDLVSFIDGKKDFVINLNNQHFFNKANATKRFIQCLK